MPSDDPFERTREQLEQIVTETGLDLSAARLPDAFYATQIVPYVMSAEEIAAWVEHEVNIDDAGQPIPPEEWTPERWAGSPGVCAFVPPTPDEFRELLAEGARLAEQSRKDAVKQFGLEDRHLVFRWTGRDRGGKGDWFWSEEHGVLDVWQTDCAVVQAEPLEKIEDPIPRMRQTLWEIALVAGIHYAGGAFDPEHMRAIANAARTALEGKPVNIALDPPSVLEAGYGKAYDLLSSIPLDVLSPVLAQSIKEFLGESE